MRHLSWLVLLLAIVGCGATLAWLLPLAAQIPVRTLPEAYARFNPQHLYKSPALLGIVPVCVGVMVVAVFTGLYFWLNEWLTGAIESRLKPPKRPQY